MTRDSQESSPEDIKQIYEKHRRATRAMLERIVLRGPHGSREQSDEEAEMEESIRSAILSTEEAILRLDPDEEHRPDVPRSLVEAMANSTHLEDLAMPGRPLTAGRLLQIDPALVSVAETMNDNDICWPDDDTVFHDVLPEDFDDMAFGSKLAWNRAHYNNFPAIISTKPSRPEEGEDIVAFWSRTKSYQYATKPYLMRAHALQPEFMDVLQRTMEDHYGMQDWVDRLYQSVTETDPDPEDLVLLRASRLAYQLLINLMRKDDLQTQGRIMTTSLQHEITDPITELFT
jgi:hypothetical protein